jgi:2',3'-cyclic-nucleotide 2'-phosphodiesterase (5'-nucleotidase family)
MRKYFLYFVFSLQLLASCGKHYTKQSQESCHTSLKENDENKATKTIVDSYKIKVESETNKVIALSDDAILKDGLESPLGNFVCDALMYNAWLEFKNSNPDVALVNRGGMRINLPKGDIKVSTIFELMPFENELVCVTISGKNLYNGITTILEKKHPFKGLKIDADKANKFTADLNGVPIDTLKNYNIITSDYLASGGDNFNFLKNPVNIQKSNLKIRDAIINYCNHLTKNNITIKPYTDGRITISN